MLIDGREVKYEVERDQDIQTDKFCIEQQQFIRLAAERLPECHFFTSTGQDDKSSFVCLSILCKPECQFSLFPFGVFWRPLYANLTPRNAFVQIDLCIFRLGNGGRTVEF
mgnify:CR=1 FL=1